LAGGIGFGDYWLWRLTGHVATWPWPQKILGGLLAMISIGFAFVTLVVVVSGVARAIKDE
jgi:hypothetical protein